MKAGAGYEKREARGELRRAGDFGYQIADCKLQSASDTDDGARFTVYGPAGYGLRPRGRGKL
jgi:hypothetical protein